MNPRWKRFVGMWTAFLFTLGLAAQGSLGGQAEPAPGMALGATHTTPGVQTFSLGHLKVTFQGRWAPLTWGGQDAGLYLEGSGELTYTSAYGPEAMLVPKNVKEWSTLTAQKGAQGWVIAPVGFSRARLRILGAPVPALEGPVSGDLGTSYTAFCPTWDLVNGYEPEHIMQAQAGNRPGRPLVFLEVEGRSERLLYMFDLVERQQEGFDIIKPFPQDSGPLKNWNYRIPLSRQPLGYDPHAGQLPVRFQLRDLDVDLRTADNHHAEMKVRETFISAQDGLQVVNLDLLSEITLRDSVRHLRVAKVTDGAGNPLRFLHSQDRLTIHLPAPLQAGTPFQLRFEYGGDFLVKPAGDSYWQLNVRGSWYPEPHHMTEESYTFHGTVRTQGDWIAFLPGETVRREKEGEWNLVETRTTQQICFATILGGKYFMEEETRDGLTLRIATYAFKGGTALKVIKDQTFAVLAYYRNFLGPYPFKELTIVEKNQWGYGQAPPTMTYITREAFEQISNIRSMQELADLVGRYGGRNISIQTMDVRHVLAHELAHQYWGTVVKMPSPEDQWVTESFAEYCAALYVRDFKGEGHFNRAVARWKAEAEDALEGAPIPLANEVHRKEGFESYKVRRGLLYAKGPLLLHSLHQALGDQVFLSWLKSTQTNFRWKFATTPALFDLLKFVSKKDHTAFYDAYFWGTAMPPLK